MPEVASLSTAPKDRGRDGRMPSNQSEDGYRPVAAGMGRRETNRVLRQLREMDLMTFQDHKVTLLDTTGLTTLAGIDSIDGP